MEEKQNVSSSASDNAISTIIVIAVFVFAVISSPSASLSLTLFLSGFFSSSETIETVNNDNADRIFYADYYQNCDSDYNDIYPHIPLAHPYRLRERPHLKSYKGSSSNCSSVKDNCHHDHRAGLDVECMLRHIAYDMAWKRVPVSRLHSDEIFRSLQLDDCIDQHNETHQQQKLFDQRRRRQASKPSNAHSATGHDKDNNHHLYLDCGDTNDVNSGMLTFHSPHDIMHHVRDLRRNRRLPGKENGQLNQHEEHEHVIVHIRHGSLCFLNHTLHIDESNMAWVVDDDDSEDSEQINTVFSGGALLQNLQWQKVHPESQIVVTDIPDGINITSIDGLFAFPPNETRRQRHPNNDGKKFRLLIQRQIRLVRARYPNGNPEVDRMPTNYDKFSGPAPPRYFKEAWQLAGNVSVRFPGLQKNSSFYPWFCHSRDIRWVQDYHLENASSYYETETQFWQPRIATAVLFNTSRRIRRGGRRENAVPWHRCRRRRETETNNENRSIIPSSQLSSICRLSEAVLHVIHYNWWGNWQWKVQDEDNDGGSRSRASQDDDIGLLKFDKGGWQDAHGGYVSHNYFYIENIWEELDAPGEWFVDKNERKLYYWPLDDESEENGPLLSGWNFVVTQLNTIVTIGKKDDTSSSTLNIVRNVHLQGVTFVHTTTSSLVERYTVPSAGDWSVLPKGAVTLSGVADVSLDHCTWWQVSGNAVALYGAVHNSTISSGDFIKTGDSGVVLVGYLPKDRPYSGVDVLTIPTNITIQKCHFGQTGVFGKQTSALFVALSNRIRFVDNVVYDGPRAGININDGFGGGHVISGNVIFNQVLESGDHGPINTWSRSLYLQRDSQGSVTATPEWNYIDSNLIMVGPKFGSLYGPGLGPCSNGVPEFYCPKNGGSLFSCLDHDDGSEYYLDTRNVCAFAGMKNYIGQNKIWDSNLIFYPEGAAAQNRSGMSCLWTSMDMAGDKDELPCSAKPCRTREVFVNNTCFTSYDEPLEYDMFNETDLTLNGIANTTIPLTANNTYYLPSGYRFQGKWTLSEAQERGVDLGSTEILIESIDLEVMDRMARNLLDLPSK